MTLENSSDLATFGLYPILNFGRYFGLLLLKIPNSHSKEISFSYNWRLLYSLYVLLSNLVIFGFAVVLFYRDIVSSESKIVEQLLDMVYHGHIVLTIIICLNQSKTIPRIIDIWNKVEIMYEAYENDTSHESVTFQKIRRPSSQYLEITLDSFSSGSSRLEQNTNFSKHKQFIKTSRIVTYSYFLCIFIGAVSYFITISINESTTNWVNYFNEVAKIYVIEEACYGWTGIYVIVIGHSIEFIWAYGDMLILSVSLMLWYQFKRFNKIVKSVCAKRMEPRDLEDLRIVHWEIAKATKETNKMLSTLTTTVFICNILYLFSRVYNGIEEDLKHPHPFINFEAAYAFSYLIIRISSTTIIATKFANETTKSFEIVVKSYSYLSSEETGFLITDRFTTQLLTSNLAITGSGYFFLNKGFIATLVSALVTYEVVILQFSAATQKNNETYLVQLVPFSQNITQT